MKSKDTFYSQNGYVNPDSTRDRWLKIKDEFWRWASNSYMRGVYGIEIKPKHRHKRSFALRNQCLVLGHDSATGYSFKHKPMRKVGKVYYFDLPHRVYVDHSMDLSVQD